MLNEKILGTDCAKDHHQTEAVAKSGIVAKFIKVENIQQILKYNLLSTPVVIVNETVK